MFTARSILANPLILHGFNLVASNFSTTPVSKCLCALTLYCVYPRFLLCGKITLM